MPAIEFCDLTLKYNSRSLIKNFNATIENGEFIGIFGPNGSGKTTLLRSILGLIKPDSGKIIINNKPVKMGNPEIGYVPQLHHTEQTNQLTGHARILAINNGYHLGLPINTKQNQQEVSRVINLVGAKHYASRPFGQLSGGEQKHILLAQSLLNNPRLLLLDEPLSNLDPHHQETIIQVVHHLQQTSKLTVLFTGHDLNPLLKVMTRIIYLAHGNAAIGTVDEIVTNEKLSWLYGMPIEVIRHKDRLFVVSQEKGETINDTHCHVLSDYP